MQAIPATLTRTRAHGTSRPSTTAPATTSPASGGVTSRAAPPQAAPMTSARGKRSQPRWRCALGAGAPGKARTAASKGTAGRSGGSGPAGPRRRRGRWARTQRRARTGRKPRTRHSSSVAAETASAAQIFSWGVQVICTVKLEPPRACRSAAVTCQPLANPSTSCDCPNSTLCEPGGAPLAGVATALQPLFTLWPSTSSKGWVAPVTSAPWLSMCTEVAVTVGAAPGWVACSCGVPAVVG